MVEVFKTNVTKEEQAALLLNSLAQHYPNHSINFDLEDCDRILRIEGDAINPIHATILLEQNGYLCAPLH